MIRLVRSLGLATGRAFASFRRRPLAALLATGSIAVALTLLSVVQLAAINIETATARWQGGVQMVVYLDEGTAPERAARIQRALDALPAVAKTEYIGPERALQHLRGSLGEHDELIEGIEAGMLPGSIEVTLKDGVKDVAAAHPVIARLESTPGVDEVEFLGEWVDRLGSLSRALSFAGWFLLMLVGLATVYTVSVTLRLGMQTRRREVGTMELLGATPTYIRGPMLLEGVLQGTAGGAGAALLSWALYRSTADAIAGVLTTSFGGVDLTFLSCTDVAILIAIGAGFGLIGSWFATGRRALD